MAMFKTCNKKGKYFDSDSRQDVIGYIFNPLKTESGFRGGINVTADVVDSMNNVAVRFKKTKGVQLRHFVLSFTPDEMDEPEIVYEIACKIASFMGMEYQVVFAVHEDTQNLHIHFVCNAMKYTDGHRYYGKKEEYFPLVKFIKDLLRYEYGIRLITVSALSEKDIQGEAIN